MQYLTRQQNRKTLQCGTSLIEVLVVLVVLVVGVLAIARLFPAGFLSLRTAENNSYASRLAQGTLDVLRQNNASLADGIYMYENGVFEPGYTPDNLKTFSGNAAYNDINKQRYVSNETITVPAAAPGSIGASLQTVNFGPFESNTLTVNGALWSVKQGDSRLRPSDPTQTLSIDNPTDELQAGQQSYLVDLNAGKLAVPPAAYPQTFMLTVNGGNPVTVTVAATTVSSAAYLGGWFGTDGGTTTDTLTGVVTAQGTALPAAPWTTVELYRPYQDVGSIGSFGADPYQYTLYNPSSGPSSLSTVAFNPLAGGRAGVPPLMARLSYSTQDWHILHEDRDVPTIPTGTTGTLRLALSGLKKVGDVQFDQTLFGGLGGSTYDIMLLDRDTGAFYGLTGSGAGENVTNLDDNSGPTAAGTTQVSYSNGRITLPDTFSGKHLRVFYAGVADWAVAVQKAPKFYQTKAVAIANFPPPSIVLSYVTDSNANTPNRCLLLLEQNSPYSKQIAFPRCDAGKMVQIAIGTQTPLSVPIPDALNSSGVQYVDVSSLFPATGAVDPTTVKVTVTGLSARAFVIWHERDNWKSRSIDTLLTHLD